MLKYRTGLADMPAYNVAEYVQKTLRSIFVCRFIRHAGAAARLMKTWDLRELSAATGLSLDQIKRVLTNLDGTVFECAERYRGRSTLLLRPDEKTLDDIDFDALDYKRELEMQRLEDVLAYARTRECRQAFLISYFGEDAGSWKCGNCDRCGKDSAQARLLSDAERRAVWTMLDCVKYYHGRLGRGRISQILSGARNADLVSRGWVRDPHFGMLKQVKQNVIQNVLRELERLGLIERCGDPEYPCLGISPKGQTFLHSPGELKCSLPPFVPEKDQTVSPPAGRKKLRKAAGPMTEDDLLFGRLRQLRTQLAQKRGCPPYMIFGDAVLRELAKQRPLCLEDAAEIKGIGPQKLHSVLPPFIREIQQWCNGH